MLSILSLSTFKLFTLSSIASLNSSPEEPKISSKWFRNSSIDGAFFIDLLSNSFSTPSKKHW